jgi:serine/threonine-protein kinase RsbT
MALSGTTERKPVAENLSPMMARIDVRSHADVLRARQKGRDLARDLGFSATDLTLIVTAISELAGNIVRHAGHGELQLSVQRNHSHSALVVVASDDGPGIRDVNRAMRGGFSTSGGLGVGLSGVRRLMDDFRIESTVDKGTVVTAKKWRRTG